MVNFGKIILFEGKIFTWPKGRCGYGVIKGNIKKLKQVSLQENINSIDYLYVASDSNVESRYEKNSDVVYTYFPTGDAVNKRLLTIFNDLKNSKERRSHNEFIMDVVHEDVKFVCWCDPKDRTTDYTKLIAAYFRKKFLDKTGRTLPIFQYKVGQEDYLEETNFSKEEIKDMIKREVLDSEGKQLKDEYNTIRKLYFFMAFKDEIKEIDEFDVIMKQFINNKILELSHKQYAEDIYDIVNIIEYAEIINEEYQQECIKEIFNKLNLEQVILGSTICRYRDSKERAKMLMIEALSAIRILVKGDTVDFLMPKLIEGVNKSMVLIELKAAVDAKNSDLVKKILEENVDLDKSFPLIYALGIYGVDEKIVQLFIDNGVDLNKEYKVEGEQITPVMYAIKKGNEGIVQLLIDNGDEKIRLLIGKELLSGVKIGIKRNTNNKKEYLAIINKALENYTVRNLLKEGKIKIIDLLDNKIVLREKPEESYERYAIDENLKLKKIKKKKRTGLSKLMCIYRVPKKLIRRLYRKYTMEYVSYDYLAKNHKNKISEENLKSSIEEFFYKNGRERN